MLATIEPVKPMMLAVESRTDERVIALWLESEGRRSEHTRKAYRRAVERFLSHVGCSLPAVTLDAAQGFVASLTGSEATRAQAVSAVKSLLAFAHRVGYTAFDVGRVLTVPRVRSRLAERIMPEADTMRLIALTPRRRDRALLLFLYASGARVSEACGLRWRDVHATNDGGQVTLWGKGSKERAVALPASVYRDLVALRGDAADDAPVFLSREGGALDASSVFRIVRAAAKRAGITGNVSPHWLRHCHASHALDRAAPIHVVAATLGHSSVAVTTRYTHARPGESSAQWLAV